MFLYIQLFESSKTDYYRVLRSCQAQRPGEDVTAWVVYFLTCLSNIQESLMIKLKLQGTQANLSARDKNLLVVIENNPGIKSGEIATKLDIPNSTVKRVLAEMIKMKLIEKHGSGPGTNYTIN